VRRHGDHADQLTRPVRNGCRLRDMPGPPSLAERFWGNLGKRRCFCLCDMQVLCLGKWGLGDGLRVGRGRKGTDGVREGAVLGRRGRFGGVPVGWIGVRLDLLGLPVRGCGAPMAKCGSRPTSGGAPHVGCGVPLDGFGACPVWGGVPYGAVWRAALFARRVPQIGLRSALGVRSARLLCVARGAVWGVSRTVRVAHEVLGGGAPLFAWRWARWSGRG
jgi:hypothetical protein